MMKILLPTEAAYIAGLVDGEGTLAVYRNVVKGNPHYNVDCRISNTNTEMLEWLQITTGIGQIVPAATQNKPNHKPGYAWNVWTIHIEPFLKQILPYLVCKNMQALLLLDFIPTIQPPKNNHIYTCDEADLKQSIYLRLKVLNKRGL